MLKKVLCVTIFFALSLVLLNYSIAHAYKAYCSVLQADMGGHEFKENGRFVLTVENGKATKDTNKYIDVSKNSQGMGNNSELYFCGDAERKIYKYCSRVDQFGDQVILRLGTINGDQLYFEETYDDISCSGICGISK